MLQVPSFRGYFDLVFQPRWWPRRLNRKIRRFTIDTPGNLDFLKRGKVEEEAPEKKKVKKSFLRVKTKKVLLKGSGNRVYLRTLLLPEKPEMPKTFVRDIYYYDYARRGWFARQVRSEKKESLLHGSVTSAWWTVILILVFFIKGTKHGRWMTYKQDSTLTDKALYFRAGQKNRRLRITTRWSVRGEEILRSNSARRKASTTCSMKTVWLPLPVNTSGKKSRKLDWILSYQEKKKLVTYSRIHSTKDLMPYVKTEWNDKGKKSTGIIKWWNRLRITNSDSIP